MEDSLEGMLLGYLRDMSERGDHTARQLLEMIEEEIDNCKKYDRELFN